MKKTIFGILICFIIILTSCNNNDRKTEIKSNNYSEPFFSFSSYEMIYRDVFSEGGRQILDKYHSLNGNSEHFEKMIACINSGEIEMRVPQYQDKEVNLSRDIVLFSSEKFDLPWVWYYCELGGSKFVFEVCYLNVLDKSFENDTYSDISKMLNSQYPTADLFDKKVYKTVYEEEITLDENYKTLSVVLDYSDDFFENRKNYRFRYNNLIVSVWNFDDDGYEKLNASLFEDISFSVLSEKNN